MPFLYSQRVNCGVTRSEFKIFVPGSQVPDWFTYHSEGSSLRIAQLMLRCRGLALCAAFSVHDPKGLCPYKSIKLDCNIQVDITLTQAVSKTPLNTQRTPTVSMSVPTNSLAGTNHPMVKECVLRPVYDSDIEQFVPASNNLSSNTSPQVSVPDRLAVTSTLIKQSCEYCPDQQPYPKRLK
ncbi:hypothetical protein Pint_07134 [Pistacia integerrima]|uniref:Uncharacterized protein n=1 Tax=Pistacia integerrima TaxID=434235 RepID=A0ACC0XUM5_9ROSI|nr:hypothetical protein Pint_07134 [Pistacia integerrima]